MDNGSERGSERTRVSQLHKFIDIRYHFIREHVVETRGIDTRRVGAKYNIADILTKPLASQRRLEFVTLIGTAANKDDDDD
ncbi:hypothetical protein LX36DRAFT_656408 [Colletotrichum falcatum]|nr:hypothetical protein LX36DRAFT_656408 [Colletotrichum falcatum]